MYRKNHRAESDRVKQSGLNSPHGRRGAICEHFGWTYDYLLHGVAWSIVQRMMIDAPNYNSEKEEKEKFEDLNKEMDKAFSELTEEGGANA